MELFNNIIWWVNIAVIVLFGGLFLFQILFLIFCFLKPRQYKKASRLHHFTFVIRAHDEEDVVADCIKSCLSVEYPKDKFNVVVFAHNCTDNTVKIAREAGAKVVIVNDAVYCKSNLGTNMKHGLDILKKEGYQTEYFLLLDADCQVDRNYLNACNDAADEGVVLGRGFESSKNLTDNLITCMSGLWYLRDSRVACGVRSAFHLGCVMNGPTSMIRSDLAFKWDALSNSEDLEFTLNRLINDKLKVEYISEATLYEDQPSTLDDVFKRNTRMGNGLNKLFWTTGIKCIWLFIKNLFNPKVKAGLKFTYLDQFFNIATIPSSFVIAVWVPLYYIYSLIYTGVVGPISIYGLGTYNFMWFLIFILSAAAALYLIPFWVQPLLSYLSERKRLSITNKKIVAKSIIFFPSFMLIQLVAIIKGIITKAKWEKIKRSKTKLANPYLVEDKTTSNNDNSDNSIEIVYAANDKMFDCVYLSILSILRRTKRKINFYLLSADFIELNPNYTIFTQNHIDIIKKLVTSYNENNSFTLIDCKDEYNKLLKGNKNEKSRYSPYACLRLLIDCYPYFKDKLLYLDADTMASGDINEFMKIDLTDNEFAVCHDCLGRVWQYRDCFNSGVILFNVNLCRKNDLFKKARDYMYKKSMYFPDQSALNLVATKFMFFPGNEYRFNQQKAKIMSDTIIKHFCARIKWWPLHNNVKQSDIKNVHRYLKIHTFDEDYDIYLQMKSKQN